MKLLLLFLSLSLVFLCVLGHDHIFEGPEKRLEIHFKPNLSANYSVNLNIRHIPRSTWDRILEVARCQIIGNSSNDFFDSYLLSESSLFVYPTKIIIKTCGTTRLLHALPLISEQALQRGYDISSVLFSRKNYFDPHLQHYPHNNFQDEVTFLKTLLKGGEQEVLGPLDGDHYCIFTYDQEDVKKYDPLLEFMMSDLDASLMNLYCKETSPFHSSIIPSPLETCQQNISKLMELIPGAENQGFFFEPCGYSLNGMQQQNYYTIHVSPQLRNSYASFETTVVTPSLLEHVLDIFKPSRFSYTWFAEDDSVDDPRDEPPSKFRGYRMVHKTSLNYGFENSKKLVFFNFERK